MVTLCYNPIDGIDIDNIVSDIINFKPRWLKPSKVVLFNELEWELRQITPEFVHFLRQRNIQIEIIFGSFNDEYYAKYQETLGLTNDELTFWPTYWINWTEICLNGVADHTQYTVDTNFKHPFICLNNKNHVHRAAVIDHLVKHNIIDKGVVTWHKFANCNHGYNFNYYDDSIRTIDDDFTTKLDSFLLPRQWHESFLHIVGEATSNVHFITEKTVIPMLLKKPYVCISKKGFNQRLIDLGFELYDELLDYSYDNHDDLVSRADKLCEGISLMDTNYSKMYELIKPKIEHNYNRCLEIIKDKSFIPSSVFSRATQIDPMIYKPMHTDARYRRIVNL
jgi:hypothetical protein